MQAIVAIYGFRIVQAGEAGTLTTAQATAYDALTGQLSVLTLLAYIASIIAFLAWFSRTIESMPPLTGSIPARTPRAAIGWWFVPVANFSIPFTIARDALRSLDPGGRSGASRLVTVWWALFLAGDAVLGMSSALGRTMSTIDEIRTVLVLSLAAVAIMTIAGSCLVIVVWSTEKTCRWRAAALGIACSGTRSGRRSPMCWLVSRVDAEPVTA